MWKVVYLLIPLVFFLGGCKTLDLSGNSSIEDAYRQGVRDGLMQKEQRIERARIPDPLKGGNFIGKVN